MDLLGRVTALKKVLDFNFKQSSSTYDRLVAVGLSL